MIKIKQWSDKWGKKVYDRVFKVFGRPEILEIS